ncbi:OmpA family protein [Sphingomonas sp. 3-13AW]|uniref:OmpA family protein n=1 Tax=Sphingomonas sp. 3-13AW TaxID=3050450 RepID=UPI003BB55FCB
MTSLRLPRVSSALMLALLVAGCQHTVTTVEAPSGPASPPHAGPVLVQAPGPWGIYFDLDQVELKPEAAPILDLVVATYGRFGRSAIVVSGHGDTTGSSPYNLQLGQRRAEAVKAYLVAKGIAPNFVSTNTDGEEDPLIPTPDEVKEQRNRRVEISFTPA